MAKVYSQVTINRMIQRGQKLLHALSRKRAIRRVAALAGYTDEEHALGWALWLYLVGFQQALPAPPPPPNPEYDDAVAKLDQWDGPHFERTRAALERLHPEQNEYIFNGLKAGTGPASIGAVNTYYNRVVALRDGTDPARAATRTADKAAIDTLAARNIFNADVAAYLRGLLDIATAGQTDAPAPVVAPEEDDPAYQAKAAEFDEWLTDWRRTLRNTVTRRDYLIQLGLASRRSAADPDAGDDDDNNAPVP